MNKIGINPVRNITPFKLENFKNFDTSIPIRLALADTFKKSDTCVEVDIENIKNNLNETKKHQGLIGKFWDGFKNITGIGASSNKVLNATNDYKNGKINKNQLDNILKKYQQGQNQCVDTIADIASGIASFASYSLATGIGLAATPFTGGASLGLVLAGFRIAGISGSAVKIGLKLIDSKIAKKKYTTLKYDLATGCINGIFAPITAGIGGAAGKFVARKVGVSAIKEGGEVVLKNALQGTVRGSLTKTFLTTNIKYTGGTMFTRGLALGADMAVNGAITGGVDSSVRYLSDNTIKDKNMKNLKQEVLQGTIGGLVAAPIIGGGMRLAGKGIGKITGKLKTDIDVNVKKAKAANAIIPTVTNSDTQLIKVTGELFSKYQKLVQLSDNLTTDNVNEYLKLATEVSSASQDLIPRIKNSGFYSLLGDLPEKLEKTTLALNSLSDKDGVLAEKLASAIQAQDKKQVQEILSSAGLGNIEIFEGFDKAFERIKTLQSNPIYKNLPKNQQVEASVENANILLAKFAQTFSNDESLPKEVREVLLGFTSKCYVSRDISQAQALVDELYGAGKYKIYKSCGAGTIGETYKATCGNKEVIIKLLKEGVSKEKFTQDREVFTKYIEEYITDEADKKYKLDLINGMFDAWDSELDFEREAKNALSLLEGSKRFSVAKPVEVGTKNGQHISMVMENAKGIELGKLLELIELYKTNPDEYKNIIKNNEDYSKIAALENPEEWMMKLGKEYQRAQNEQIMFISKNGTRTVHADPHPGNVFIYFDEATKMPKIEYIDAGNVVKRSANETLEDIILSLNMMIGNSKGIANAMLEGATLPNGANKEVIIEKFSKMLDERLFKANINVKDSQYVQSTINQIMKELQIIPNANNLNLIKATLQRVETSRAINRICGTKADKTTDIKDLLHGILKSFVKNPKETTKEFIPVLKCIKQDKDQSMQTLFQMILPN